MAWNKIAAKSLSELFWPKVVIAGPDECWNWSAARSSGYGSLQVYVNRKRRSIRSHVASWELHRGPAQPDLYVLHRCDNRLCCNPSHLFLGTQADNVHDAVSKGRHAHGSKASYSTLNEEQVRIIRKQYDSYPRGKGHPKGIVNQLASDFGVSKSTICMIAKRRTWRHVA